MTPFTVHTGVAAPLLRENVDTDAIIPSREMRTTGKSGLAPGLFAGWRYQDQSTRTPNPDFILNRPEYHDCSILLAGSNFGCGSSREHAVWALKEFGIRCIIAPSFGAIFANNCVRNGLLPLPLPAQEIAELADRVAQDPQHYRLRIDLESATLTLAGECSRPFSVDSTTRRMLLEGLDAIGLTLQSADNVQAFITEDRRQRPWAYIAHDSNR